MEHESLNTIHVKYQLLHVSAPRCHPQGVVVTTQDHEVQHVLVLIECKEMNSVYNINFP